MKTYSARPHEIERRWYIVDAADMPLGRLATRVATVLRGKHKPMYTPHMDTGDHVVIVNARNLVFTGSKMDKKTYQRFSGYPSGLYTRTARQQLKRDPTQIVWHAVRGMLPKNRLGRQMATKLKVYAGPQHPHAAQKPVPMDLGQG